MRQRLLERRDRPNTTGMTLGDDDVDIVEAGVSPSLTQSATLVVDATFPFRACDPEVDQRRPDAWTCSIHVKL